VRGQSEWAVAVRLLEDDGVLPQGVQVRRGALPVSVERETIGAERVDGDEDDGRAGIPGGAVRAARGEDATDGEPARDPLGVARQGRAAPAAGSFSQARTRAMSALSRATGAACR